MGFFDLFKSKKREEELQPEVVAQDRKDLDAGLEKTKEGFFSKRRCS